MSRSYGVDNEPKSQNLPMPQQTAPETPQRFAEILHVEALESLTPEGADVKSQE